ncbi:MAG: hypothetical protein IPP97_28695 [Candidatus Obscuribacter sp.]|nr:hypothetical protein [Candidatus Obscuribacter sp.]
MKETFTASATAVNIVTADQSIYPTTSGYQVCKRLTDNQVHDVIRKVTFAERQNYQILTILGCSTWASPALPGQNAIDSVIHAGAAQKPKQNYGNILPDQINLTKAPAPVNSSTL